MLTSILRRSIRPDAVDRAARQRRRLAHGLEGIAAFATPTRRGPRGLVPIIRADVAAACAAPAASLAAVLRHPATPVDAALLADVHRFLTDGCTSPLYAASPHDALLAVSELASRASSRGATRQVVAV